MAVKIFLTGVTGYVGGDALVAVLQAFPDAQVTALVRNAEKGAPVTATFPHVNLVFGDLDSFQVIEEQSAIADFVIHTADSADNLGAAKAIGKGILAGHSKEKPGYWLHTGGTGILTWHDSKAERYGEPPIPENTYDDWDGIQRIIHLPDDAFHRNVDVEVQKWGYEHGEVVKAAIICPPTIYGIGRGPVNQRSRQIPLMCRMTLKDGKAPIVGKGLSEHDHVHIRDLSSMFVLLIKAALASTPGIWGPEAYYFTPGGQHRWGDLSKLVGKVAKEKGYIQSDEVKPVDIKEALETKDYELISWSLNSLGVGKRAEKLLGWKPNEKSLEDSITESLEVEAALLTVGNES